jgi:hypothetical protein
LLQYTGYAATNRELLFYLFDNYMQHSFMKQMSTKIRSNHVAFDEYAQMLNSPEWRKKIIQAAEDPRSKVAKEIIATVLPVLSFGSRNSLLGSMGDNTSVSRAMAVGT